MAGRQARWAFPEGGHATTAVEPQLLLRAGGDTLQHLIDFVAACAREKVDRESEVDVLPGPDGGFVLSAVVPR